MDSLTLVSLSPYFWFDKDFDEAAVKLLFEQHGKVDLVSMPRDKATGKPRGFCFVDMNSANEMNAACARLNGSEVMGRVMRVSLSVGKDELPTTGKQRKERPARKSGSVEEEGYKKLYVGNISFGCTKEELMEFFTSYGLVKDVFIPTDPSSGNGRGFAFVTMKEEDAEVAIEKSNGQEFAGRKITVSLPLPPGKKAPERYTDRTKLYVGNLSFYTVKDTLQEIFKEFGTVHDCYMPEDPSTGGSRGFGFVSMDSDAAAKAIKEIDGCEVDGRIITVNEAQPKKLTGGSNGENGEEL
jgi:nucleolin